MAVTKNPLDGFASRAAGNRNFKLPDLPKLAELVKDMGFAQGLVEYDRRMESWRQSAEGSISERINPRPS